MCTRMRITFHTIRPTSISKTLHIYVLLQFNEILFLQWELSESKMSKNFFRSFSIGRDASFTIDYLFATVNAENIMKIRQLWYWRCSCKYTYTTTITMPTIHSVWKNNNTICTGIDCWVVTVFSINNFCHGLGYIVQLFQQLFILPTTI